MKYRSPIVILGIVCILATAALFADNKRFFDFLNGYEETPAVSTNAFGDFRVRISRDGTSIDYRLTYTPLEAPVTQSHIHFGQKGVAGGISVWLCSNLASPPTPVGVQSCPTPGGSVSGTITAAHVVGPTGQGIEPGQFAELIAAMRAGKTYANVHSTKFPAGEIRAQIDPGFGH